VFADKRDTPVKWRGLASPPTLTASPAPGKRDPPTGILGVENQRSTTQRVIAVLMTAGSVGYRCVV